MTHISKILDDFVVEQVVSCNLINRLVLDPQETLLEGGFGIENLVRVKVRLY